jgi:hypothetical protein
MPAWLWILIGVVVAFVSLVLWLLRLAWDNRPPDLAGMKWPWS